MKHRQAPLLAITAIALGLTGVPAGHAIGVPAVPGVPGTEPAARATESQTPTPIPQPGQGFDWPDAAIGFGVGVAGLALCGGLALVTRRTPLASH
jgi:hypothetical protein